MQPEKADVLIPAKNTGKLSKFSPSSLSITGEGSDSENNENIEFDDLENL